MFDVPEEVPDDSENDDRLADVPVDWLDTDPGAEDPASDWLEDTETIVPLLRLGWLFEEDPDETDTMVPLKLEPECVLDTV